MNIIKLCIKNVSHLAIGALVSQLIQFFSIIYIAKLLGPETYGIYASVLAFVGVFTVFTFSGLNKVILRLCSKSPDNINTIMQSTVGLRSFALVSTVIICIIAANVAYDNTKIILYICIASLNMAITGIHTFLSLIYQAMNKMKIISYFNLLSTILIAVFSILVLYLGYGLQGIIIVNLVSNIIVLIVNFKMSRSYITFKAFPKLIIDMNIVRQAAIFSLLSFLTTIATRTDLLMLSAMGTSEEVGIYSVAFKIAQRFTMLRNIISTGIFPIFVGYFAQKKVNRYKLYKYSIAFATIVILVASVVSNISVWLVNLLFGVEYIKSAGILSILIYAQAFNWATIPFTTAAQVTHNEGKLVWILLVSAIMNLIMNYILYQTYGLVGIAYSTVIVLLLNALLSIIIVNKELVRSKYYR